MLFLLLESFDFAYFIEDWELKLENLISFFFLALGIFILLGLGFYLFLLIFNQFSEYHK